MEKETALKYQNININNLILDDCIYKNKKFKVVISGGGLRALYGIGCLYTLKNIKSNIIGLRVTSAGCFGSLFLASGLDMDKITPFYKILTESYYNNKDLIHSIRTIIEDQLIPDNIAELMNDLKVEIVVNKITKKGLKEETISNFESRDHLIKCIEASCCIPFLTKKQYPYCIKIGESYYIDGGLMKIIPVYYEKEINQLQINLFDINYNKFNFKPLDPNIKNLISKGLFDMCTFLNSNFKNNIIVYTENSISEPIIYKYTILNIVYVICVFIINLFTYFISND